MAKTVKKKIKPKVVKKKAKKKAVNRVISKPVKPSLPVKKNIPRPLNFQQDRFCNEYIIDFHATNAAIRAGYSPRSAYQIGSDLLKKVEIQERIKEITKDVFASVGISQARVYRELARLAFFDIRDIYNQDGSMKPLKEFSADSAAALSGVTFSQEVSEDEKGDKKVVTTTVDIKVINKKGALDTIVKIGGWEAPTKIAQTNKEGDNVKPAITLELPPGLDISLPSNTE